MQLEHEFTVPVPVEQAWDVLLDVERLAPCMPGAVLDEVRGDEFDGRVKVKVGPITVTYGGTARFLEKDVENRRLVIKASGKEAKGAGTAAATITAVLKGSGDETQVTVATDLAITGRPAQFGRGVMVDVSNKLLGMFTDCLAEQISPKVEPQQAAPQPSTDAPVSRAEPEAIDLLGVSGTPVLKRLAPVAAVVALLVVLLGVRRARRR
ncbi:MAG TPA: SRPBCC family protein [Sporichthyaceae bacterium]|jgi:carbon monoxide dehydrogenase subunit G